MFKILHIVSKRFKPFRQSIFSNCSLVSDSCRLFSLTWASSHLIAIITPNIIFGMGCDESDKPKENSSPESQINTRLVIPGYHHTDSKKWHGNSSCVYMVLLQFRFPDSSTSGSTSINNRGIASLSSTALLLLIISATVFQNPQSSHQQVPLTSFHETALIRLLFFLELRRASVPAVF